MTAGMKRQLGADALGIIVRGACMDRSERSNKMFHWTELTGEAWLYVADPKRQATVAGHLADGQRGAKRLRNDIDKHLREVFMPKNPEMQPVFIDWLPQGMDEAMSAFPEAFDEDGRVTGLNVVTTSQPSEKDATVVTRTRTSIPNPGLITSYTRPNGLTTPTIRMLDGTVKHCKGEGTVGLVERKAKFEYRKWDTVYANRGVAERAPGAVEFTETFTLKPRGSSAWKKRTNGTRRYGFSQGDQFFGIVEKARANGIITVFQEEILNHLIDGDGPSDLAARYPDSKKNYVQKSLSLALKALRDDPQTRQWAEELGFDSTATKGERFTSEHRHTQGVYVDPDKHKNPLVEPYTNVDPWEPAMEPKPSYPFVCTCDDLTGRVDVDRPDKADPLARLIPKWMRPSYDVTPMWAQPDGLYGTEVRADGRVERTIPLEEVLDEINRELITP